MLETYTVKCSTWLDVSVLLWSSTGFHRSHVPKWPEPPDDRPWTEVHRQSFELGNGYFSRQAIEWVLFVTPNDNTGLCFRCEHRVAATIAEHHGKPAFGPRYQCSGGYSVGSCYLYTPVRPFIVQRKDPRNDRVSPVGLASGPKLREIAPGETFDG